MHLYQPFQPSLTETGLQTLGLGLQQAGVHPALQGIVHSYLQVHASRPSPYPIMPEGSQAIFFCKDGAFLGGTLSQATAMRLMAPGEYFGIRFYPGALRQFFSVDLAEIQDQFVDLKFLPATAMHNLPQEVYRFESFRQRAQYSEQVLLRLFMNKKPDAFDHALSLIYQHSGNLRISKLSELVGWSSRHLNRLFRQHTGLGSKAFSQVIRLQQVSRHIYQYGKVDANLALASGFSDQSHLINSFNKHLHHSPGQFLKQFMSDFYNP
jgi:AraC-like DNA-binding protein